MSEKQQKKETKEGQFMPRSSSKEGKAMDTNQHPDERKYTLSISEDMRRKSFDIEDERWSRGQQIGDWVKLGAVIAIYLIVTYVVYLFEPGLR